jgi:hypothetical protein
MNLLCYLSSSSLAVIDKVCNYRLLLKGNFPSEGSQWKATTGLGLYASSFLSKHEFALCIVITIKSIDCDNKYIIKCSESDGTCDNHMLCYATCRFFEVSETTKFFFSFSLINSHAKLVFTDTMTSKHVRI